MEPGAEGAYQDSHNDGSTRQAQLDRHAHTRDGDGDGPQRQSEHDAHKHGNQVGLLQVLDGIAQHLLHILYGCRFTHYGQAVAQLQGQTGSSQQLHTVAVDAADVHTIVVAQVKRTQLLAVELTSGHHDALRHQLAVDGIPVNVLLVPVGMLLFAEEHRQSRHILLLGHHQQAVALAQHLLRGGYAHVAVAPQAGDDELRVAESTHFAYALIKYRRIVYLEGDNKGLIDILFPLGLQVAGLDEELTHQ